MTARELAQPDLDPDLEHLMSEMDDALFAGRPTDGFEREIAERFGEDSSHIVSTLKALHSARAASLSWSSSSRSGGEAAFDHTQSTSEATTWVRATSGLERTVFGRFEILERIGSGGAGTVFRARDSRLERLIALKVARAEALFSSEAKQRFVREAQTLAALRHPNIIPIYEFGESGGLPYIVEELCEGPNLAVWLRQKVDAREQIAIRAAVQWTLLLAEAVAHAHRCGIVHRDLKPSNVLLGAPAPQASRPLFDDSATENLVPRVTDFGIAKLFESEESVTASQAVLGTAAYMAPEQAEGRSSEVGPPADVYSLGVILYELLAGRRPIEGRSDVDTLRRVLTDEPLPLTQVRRDVPLDLEAICLKCLDKDSANRYPSAAELAEDLAHFLKGEPVSARRLRPVARLFRRMRRRQLPPAVAVAAFFALSVVAVMGILIIRARNGDLIIWQSNSLDEPQPVVAKRQTYPEDIHQADLLLHRAEPDLKLRREMANEARRLLAKYIPGRDEKDLRGFEWHYLWRAADPQAFAPMFVTNRTISAHDGLAFFVSFSPNGRFVATASNDKTARVWDVATGKLRAIFSGHTNDVNCVVFSPDEKTLATASDDGTVRLWDIGTATFRKAIWNHTCPIIGVAFNPANGQLACSASDGTISIFDCASSKPIATIRAHAGQKIDDLSFSCDGKMLATAGRDATARLWDPSANYRQLAEFQVPDARSVGFSHDRQKLAVGSSFGASIYHIRTGELLSQIPIEGQKVRCVQFTGDDSSLVTAGDLSADRLVDLTTGEIWDPFVTSAVLWGAAVSPKGELIATVDATGKLVLWDCSARLGFRRTELDVPAGSSAARLAMSSEGGRIAVAADAVAAKNQNGAGELAVWDISLPQPQRLLQLASAKVAGQFRDVVFSPDGSTIAYAEHQPQDGRDRIRVVDAATGTSRFEIDTGQVDSLFYTPGGSMLVSQELRGSPANLRLQICDARTGAEVRTIPLRSNPALFAFSPSENLFASAGEKHDSQIDLYRLPDEKRIATLNGFGETIHALAISKDGKHLIGRGDGGYVAVLSRETGPIVRQFTVPGVSSVDGYAMSISPDGRALALGSKNAIVLADLESGQALCSLPFPAEMKAVTTIAFASDGRTLAANTTTSQGHCGVYVWQVRDSLTSLPQAGGPTVPAVTPSLRRLQPRDLQSTSF
jgi:WD40 repeat protein/serine/threonine protein kinase